MSIYDCLDPVCRCGSDIPAWIVWDIVASCALMIVPHFLGSILLRGN